MKKSLAAVLLIFALVAPARAGSLTISGSLQPPAAWDGTSASPTFTVAVQNPVGAVTVPVIGWSLGLSIVPEAGAVGTVSFASATVPANYLFATDSGGISIPPLPATSILAFDTATDNGVVVPATGDNLLALTFSATSGTSGKFQIEALGDPNTGSYWIPNDGVFAATAFGNVPFGTNLVSLGVLTVTTAAVVPEPQSAVMLISALVTLLAYRCVRRGPR